MHLARSGWRFAVGGIAVLGLASVAALVLPGTFGFLNANTKNAANAVSTGTLTMANTPGSGAILSAIALKPGSVACAQVTVTNSGRLPGQFQLSESNVTGSFGTGTLGRGLSLVITQGATSYTQGSCAVSGGTTIYSGPFDSVTAPGIKLTGTAAGGVGANNQAGDWLTGESHVFTFVVTFPSSGATLPAAGSTPGPTAADNAYQLETVSAEFDWYSAQSRATVITNT